MTGAARRATASLPALLAVLAAAGWTGVACRKAGDRGRPAGAAAAQAGDGQVSRVDRRLLLVGVDGATWKLIDPLLAAHRMPNLERLIAGGVRTPLATIRPTLSPAIWTTKANACCGSCVPTPSAWGN